MAAYEAVQVKWIHHWNGRLFSLATERSPAFRFENGHFTMLGLNIEGRPTLRAYSIASADYEDHLEFLSIKVPGGALTSRLQAVREGDRVLLGRKPVGSLVLGDLHPGRNLYLLATGTGLAPFLSIVRDPRTYQRFERVVLVHGVRHVSDLAYQWYLRHELPEHPYVGERVREQLLYYPTVTRERFVHQGRITELLDSGRLWEQLGLAPLQATQDRAMLCGSLAMIDEVSGRLDSRGFRRSPSQGEPGDYVVERAFVS